MAATYNTGMTDSVSTGDPVATVTTVFTFAGLSPDTVLDALDSVGLFGDGRLLALNSYENRVYQVGMEEGLPLVAKFYRPARWSDAAIYLADRRLANPEASRLDRRVGPRRASSR